MDKQIRVKFAGGRECSGVLKVFMKFAYVVCVTVRLCVYKSGFVS